MGRLIVTSFTTLDGVVEDPDGSDGTPFGGWAMRHGPQGVAGDKFRLGPILEHGTLLFGRRTWDHFRTLWPHRDDSFSQAMNAATKAVVTHRPVNEAELADEGLVEEYRLLAFPTVLRAGRGLFRGRRELTLISSEHVGPAVLAVLAPEPQERS